MRVSRYWNGVVILSCLLCVGCDDVTPGTDGGAPRDDGGTISRSCDGRPPVELGHCQISGGGECVGAPDEMSEFTSLSEGDTMRMVIGPQGSTMLVFSMRAEGIVAGTSEAEWPRVEIVLLDGSSGRQLAFFRGREEFVAGPGGALEALQLWVVVDDLAAELNGASVFALSTVRDSTGVERCGTARITVGR